MKASVSVVIPCYCCIDTIKRAVKSVADQSVVPAEVILVDDASPDGTLIELERLKSEYAEGWIQVVSLEMNSGPGTARNRGWDLATQDYIAFLDADDAWHTDKIRIQYEWMIANPEANLTGHSYSVVSQQIVNEGAGSELFKRDFSLISKHALLFSNRFSTPCVMLKKDLPFRYKEGKYFAEDYLLWLTICIKAGGCFKSTDILGYLYKPAYGKSGLSAQMLDMEKGELDVYSHIFKEGLIGILGYFIFTSVSLLKFARRYLLLSIKRA